MRIRTCRTFFSFFAALLLLPLLAAGQTEKPASEDSAAKGATPLSPAHALAGSPAATRAVVVGISDYQDPDIPDLKYAHRDAEAFANWLRSPAGGALDNNHLKVLTNENATAGRVAEALDALVEQTKPGEQVVIYFSGHGDVERNSISQPGFLLCHNAPSRVYMGGGTYSLAYLEEIVTTLAAKNMAKITVITDACHAGKLAGSQIGGARLTAANLVDKISNAVKILSCQPGEYSLEGEQWGGGRGCFSYHLVDGLFGLADRNGDQMVTLGELDRYLEDRVTIEAAPQSQVPMLLGNKTERLATVDAQILADLQKYKSGQLPMFQPVEQRGFEEEVLAGVDSSIQEVYRAFKRAVQEKRFFEPEGNCAEAYYSQLAQEKALARLQGVMRRNYAAALIDDAQEVMNEWLKTGQNQALSTDGATNTGRLPQTVFTEKVKTFPRCLERAANLLGKQHYMYASLQARKCFFEGYLLTNSNQNPNKELGGRALALFNQSLQWQAEQPQVYWQMSNVCGRNLLQPDSAEYYARLAVKANPSWILPLLDAAFMFCYQFRLFERAKPYLEQAIQIDSNSVEVWLGWESYYYYQKQYAEAERLLWKALSLDSTYAYAWNNLGILYNDTKRYIEGETVLKKAISLDSTYSYAWNNLGVLYNNARQYAQAEPVLKKSVSLDSMNAPTWNNLGYAYLNTLRYIEAEAALKKAISLDSTYAYAWNNLGYAFSSMRQHVEAEAALKKAISLDSLYSYAWNNLGVLFNNTQRYAEAVLILKKAVLVDSTNTSSWNNLGFAYINMQQYAEAEPVLRKAISLDLTFAFPHKHLGMVFLKTNRLEAARQSFLRAIELNPDYARGRLGMAYLLTAEKKPAEALNYVEQAIGKGSTFEQLQTDPDLASLRTLPEWKALMKKYFPEQIKD